MGNLMDAIDDLYSRTKLGILPLDKRFSEIERLVEKYSIHDPQILDRLADLCLYEDITDNTAWKTRQSEYPFLSETQLVRRREGNHQRKNEGGQREVSLKATETIDMTGRDFRKPIRKEMSTNQMIQRDKDVQSRNKERRRKYIEFTRVQPVITYRRSDNVDTNNAT